MTRTLKFLRTTLVGGIVFDRERGCGLNPEAVLS